MEKYPLPELVQRWAREEVTVEQAIGQILLWLMALVERVAKLEATQFNANKRRSAKS